MLALVFERDPPKLEDVVPAALSWFQEAGVFAVAGLAIFLVYTISRRKPLLAWSPSGAVSGLFILALLGTCFSYGALGLARIPDLIRWFAGTPPPAQTSVDGSSRLQQGLLIAGGAFAVAAVALPFLAGLVRLRPRRIGAIARLCFKEAAHRRVLWAFFSALLLIFLIAPWFSDSKSEKQVEGYVNLVSFVMTVLLLFAGCLLAALSIPTDISQQTIYTVLTKPVERFEVVLGRFFGNVLLMTVVLLGAATLSLIYVLRGVDPDAAEESLKARIPLYGELVFEGTGDTRRGENVGREWDYRSYISGPNLPNPTQYAIWNFASLPRIHRDGGTVRCEFMFDIFRTTKGKENTPITCTFTFETWRYRPEKRNDFLDEQAKRRKSEPHDAVDVALAEKYGYYKPPSKPIADYHTLHIDIPAALIKNAMETDDARRRELEEKGQTIVPLRVRVNCNDRTQFVGMAQYDLYFRLDDHLAESQFLGLRLDWDLVWFSWNFYKGQLGLWFRLCLVIGMAVALSTYLSGVISFFCTVFLIVAGMFPEFIRSLAYGTNYGGGSIESMLRLYMGDTVSAPLRDDIATRLAVQSDVVTRWMLRFFLDVLPDFNRYGLSDYMSEGFNIPVAALLVNLVYLIGYLLPWGLLAYFLIQAREIASST